MSSSELPADMLRDMPSDLAAILASHAHREGPLLPILHDVQAAFGCVDAAAEARIALALNLSRAEVHGVVSFYHDFTAEADPRPAIQLCRAEACKARGVEALVSAAEATAGDRVRISTVYCLGLCSVGPNARTPNARTGDTLHARLDEAGLIRLIASL
jgi:formate dehydrogenase subunit gamma